SSSKVFLFCLSVWRAREVCVCDILKYGEVQSPGYPAPYPPSHNEIWDLLVPQGYALSLTFTNIDIEPSKNCYYDSLMVLHKKRILGVFCGQNHVSKADHPGNYSIKSPGNSLRLVFKTDSSSPGSHKGFSATYQAVAVKCGYPKIPENNHCRVVTENPKTVYQAEIRFGCESKYYRLEGDEVYRCEAQGYWRSVNGNRAFPKCVAVCGEPEFEHSNFGRIFGGSAADAGQIPWQIFVETPRGGASLISDRWVLTAANVVEGQDSLLMYGGAVDIDHLGDSNNTVFLESEKIFIHPGYPKAPTRGRRTNYNNDIALVRLKSRVPLGPHLLPICLPERKDDGTVIPGRVGYVSGWGTTEHGTISSRLLYTQIPVIDKNPCSKRKTGRPLYQTFSENMFCAGEKGKDSCYGDSGGPFFLREFRRGPGGEIERGPFRLYGIVSWGLYCQERGYYTKVDNYLDWIREIIEKEE
uniref:Complement component 1, s subcomponent.2 n=1 Tax=Lepisosteus oculatus TaxID=7918 RepID=W5MLG1_LEPOC